MQWIYGVFGYCKHDHRYLLVLKIDLEQVPVIRSIFVMGSGPVRKIIVANARCWSHPHTYLVCEFFDDAIIRFDRVFSDSLIEDTL